MQALTAAGANVNATNNVGTTPLMTATGLLLAVHLPFNLTEEGSLLIAEHQLEDDRARIVRFLLQHGANPNARAENGGTALMDAAQTDQPEIIEALLNRGALINVQDHYGETAVFKAAA